MERRPRYRTWVEVTLVAVRLRHGLRLYWKADIRLEKVTLGVEPEGE